MAPNAEVSRNSQSEEPKSRKPIDSNLRQQRLPAWHPILTAGTVLPTFFVIGVAFLPIGIGMLYFSANVMELEIDYTDCKNSNNQPCWKLISENKTDSCNCIMNFTLDQDWSADVFLYYGLTNFYQNHRRYVKSRDDNQLIGNIETPPSTDCDPFRESGGLIYIPCGAIANSLFSDTIELLYLQPNDNQLKKVDLLRTGIAWESDKQYKFRNPPLTGNETLEEVFRKAKYIRPKMWYKDIWELDPENPENNGLQNEDLMVWMRTAALPNFRKLYRRVNHTGIFEGKLPKLDYKLNITYRYEVKKFSGTKSVILSNTSILGGKNDFLGIAYIVVGGICLIMGIVFLLVHIKYGKSTMEMINITSRTPYN